MTIMHVHTYFDTLFSNLDYAHFLVMKLLMIIIYALWEYDTDNHTEKSNHTDISLQPH